MVSFLIYIYRRTKGLAFFTNSFISVFSCRLKKVESQEHHIVGSTTLIGIGHRNQLIYLCESASVTPVLWLLNQLRCSVPFTADCAASLAKYMSIYLSIYISIYLSIYISIYLSIHPSIYISVLSRRPLFSQCRRLQEIIKNI